LPWNAKPNFFLSEHDIALARSRMKAIGRKEAQPWTKKKVVKLFTTWHIYILPLLYVIWNNSSIQSPFGYWLKSFNIKVNGVYPQPGTSYTVSQINLLPIPTTIIFVVFALVQAWISDGIGGIRYPFIILGAIISIIIGANLVNLPVYGHDKQHFALYYLTSLGGGAGPMILNWISEISAGDNEYRAILVAAGNDLAYVVQAVAPNFVWKTTAFPAARQGIKYSLGLQTLLIFWTLLVLFLHEREKKQKTRSAEENTEAPAEEPTLEEKAESEKSRHLSLDETEVLAAVFR